MEEQTVAQWTWLIGAGVFGPKTEQMVRDAIRGRKSGEVVAIDLPTDINR